MPAALVTGAAGSVGREVAKGLAERGWFVRAFDLPVCDFSQLEGRPEIEVVRGDLTTTAALAGIGRFDAVVHLAALLPPTSERDRDLTFLVNVEGTRRMLDACGAAGSGSTGPQFILASSVATYGDTRAEQPPITVEHPQRPVDIYGESKVAAERLVVDSGLPYTILRIAAISIPAVLEPPEVWPFSAEQRVEFVAHSDAVLALLNSVGNSAAVDKVLNVAGGPSWRLLGRQYVVNMYEILQLDPEDARYRAGPTWFDWYDTEETEAILRYRRTPYQVFLNQLRRVAEEEFA